MDMLKDIIEADEPVDILQIQNVLDNVKTRGDIEAFENFVNSMPEALGEDPFPLFQKLGAGTYTREIHLPAGHFVVGKLHKHESMVYMLRGKVMVADENGTRLVEAPCQFVSKAGVKRVGFVVEDVVWIDIHAVESDTVEEAEKEIFADSYDEYEYCKMIEEMGFTERQVRAISENTLDMTDVPHDGIIVKDSPIEGKGIFATKPFTLSEFIGTARIGDKRTMLGRYANHSFEPNARSYILDDKILFVATKPIAIDDEITIDYRDARASAQGLDIKIGGDECQA